MAVDAVAAVVLQKLRDLLLEASFTKNKVIAFQLEQMQDALKEMRGFSIDAANKEANVDEEIKKWTNEYLGHLYDVEDSIELFALRITRQRKRLGFLMNHALFLKKFTACKMLRLKLDRIHSKIKKLKDQRPNGLKDASLRVTGPQQIIELACFSVDENGDVEKEREEEDDDDKGVEEERKQISTSFEGPETDGPRSNLRRTNSSPPTISITEVGNSRSFFANYSFKISHNSFIRERSKDAKLMYGYSFNEEELSIIGYKSKVTELRKRLDKWDDRIITLVGEAGSGKTMLARAIYGNRNIKNHFKPACAWVTIFKESTMTDILINVLKQVQESKEKDARISEDSLKESLSRELKRKRYLIVLDDVQSLDQWRSLEDAFTDQQNGSKIILTTRDEKLADLSMKPHVMERLNPEESWTLFMQKSGLKTDLGDSMKKRVGEVCQGLPLNIVLFGSLLSMKEVGEWASILNSHEIWQTMDIVMLSYNDLDAHLKLCLIYMTLFPKDLDIPVRRLQRLWLAEGFVKQPDNQEKFQEDVAQEYFENLVKRSLIMLSKMRSAGSPRKCRLLGIFHDFLSYKARDISLFHVKNGGSDCCNDGEVNKRRLVEYADGKNCLLQSSEYQRLRSYISFNFQKKDTPAKYVGSLVSNMIGKGLGLLRVLDLEGVYKPSLPENLGDLFHLRYLGLRWTFSDKLPKSVGGLPYLETLDLKHTYINRIPPSIWKLKHLRHLNLNEVHLDKDTPLHSRSSLPKILTLWGLSVNHDSPVKNGLSRLTHLRELGISLRLSNESESCTLPSTQFKEDLVEWISKLTDLQSLRLRSKDDAGHPADLILKSFSRLNNLSHMNLVGKLQQLPDLIHFPPHIKVLTLSVSHLKQDPMPILGELPDLTVLRLLAKSYVGERMVCPKGRFESLEVLKLWKLDDLKEWEVEEGAMKKLKELHIRCCSKLESIPSRLLQQRNFKDLILDDMPRRFEENIDRNNRGEVSITVKNSKSHEDI